MELASSTLALPTSSAFHCSTIPLSFSASAPAAPSHSLLHFRLLAPFASVKTSSPGPTRSCIPRAKFEKFDGFSAEGDIPEESKTKKPPPLGKEDAEVEEEDSDLPTDLNDAVRQSSRASAAFVSSGGMRAIVELLIPQLQFLDAEGAQAEMWELSRIFLKTFMEETGNPRVKAIFPDTGAAALLKYQWQDAAFGFASLSDRKPVDNEDEVVVMLLPDYQMLEYVERIASRLSDDPPRPLIMWNPRLVSEDVGVGFNVRKLRRIFLSTFTPVYSMKRLPSGAVFRCYPGLWKVFYDDKDRPNRYRLAKEQPARPDASELELIFGGLAEKSDEGPSLLDKVGGVFSSLSRFMKAIS